MKNNYLRFIRIVMCIAIICLGIVIGIKNKNKQFSKEKATITKNNNSYLAYKESDGKVLFKVNFSDQDSGVKTVEYYVSSSSSIPSATSSTWTTSNEFSLECGSIYYVFARGIDNAGNISDVLEYADIYPSFCARTEYDGTIDVSSGDSSCDVVCQMNNYASDWKMVDNSNLPDSIKDILKTQLHDFNVNLVENNNLGYTFNNTTGEWKDKVQEIINDKGANDVGFEITETKTSQTRRQIEVTTTEGDNITIKCKYGRVSATYVNGEKVGGATGESC